MSHNLTAIPTFGEYLKHLRLTHRLTQVELASKLIVDISYISKLENGKTDHAPSDRLIEDAVLVFGFDVRQKLYVLAGKLPPEIHARLVGDKLAELQGRLFG